MNDLYGDQWSIQLASEDDEGAGPTDAAQTAITNAAEVVQTQPSEPGQAPAASASLLTPSRRPGAGAGMDEPEYPEGWSPQMNVAPMLSPGTPSVANTPNTLKNDVVKPFNPKVEHVDRYHRRIRAQAAALSNLAVSYTHLTLPTILLV